MKRITLLGILFVLLLALASWQFFSMATTTSRAENGQLEAPAETPSPTPLPTVVPTPSPTISPSAPPEAAYVQPRFAPKVNSRILMYHYVREVSKTADPLGYRLSVSPDVFERQLQQMESMGLRGGTVIDVVSGKAEPNTIALSFDDGYEDFYTNAFPKIKARGWSATVYVITDWVGRRGYLSWQQLEELNQYGIEIASHTATHRELDKLSTESQRDELVTSKTVLEQRFGKPVYTLCYPVGEYSEETKRIAESLGYVAAVTTSSGIISEGTDAFAVPRKRISGSMSNSAFVSLLR